MWNRMVRKEQRRYMVIASILNHITYFLYIHTNYVAWLSNILVNNNIPIILTNTIDSFLCLSIQTAASFRKNIRGRTQMFKKHGNMNNHLWFFYCQFFHYYAMAWVTFYIKTLGWTTRTQSLYFGIQIIFLRFMEAKIKQVSTCRYRFIPNWKISIKLGIIRDDLIKYTFNMSQKSLLL